jgi:hypothetical protein
MAVVRLRRAARVGKISWLAVALLHAAWGNIFYTASWFYLRQVARCARETERSILECGSGATTLLVGALTVHSGRKYQVLEHNPQWFQAMQDLLQRCHLEHVELVLAPLGPFDDFNWYAPSGDFCFADAIDLVICDGPPSGSTVGGRYGLLPLLQENLSESCTLLLDDAHRRSERATLSRWRGLARFDYRHHHSLFGSSTELTLR